MVGYPFLYNLWISLHVDRLSASDGAWVGLKNYIDLVTNGSLAQVVSTTFVWTVACLVFGFLIGFGLALALDRTFRGAGLIRTVLLAPWVMPGVVIAAIWLAIFNPIGGLANTALDAVGLPTHDWLGDPATALGSLVLVNVWKSAPFWMLMTSAALKAVPAETLEAAKLDGAGYFKRLVFVIVPQIREVLVLTTLLSFIWTFNYFDLAYVLTQGGPNGATTTVPFEIYQVSFAYFRFDQGAAWSVVSFLLMTILIVFYIRLSRRRERA